MPPSSLNPEKEPSFSGSSFPKIFAIGDPHLSFGTPNKGMERFGNGWENWTEKLKENIEKKVTDKDLLLIPGDISWAMHLKEALIDLEWIAKLPGTKVIIRGNHDYWWSSMSQIKKAAPPSLHFLQNDSFMWNTIAICGARLWDTPEFSFSSLIDFVPNERQNLLYSKEDPEETEKIFLRELGRLELSLKSIPKEATYKIAMTHYPPIGPELKDSRAHALFKKYGVNLVVFGHLHSLKPLSSPFLGTKDGVTYALTSADFLHFDPLFLKELSC